MQHVLATEPGLSPAQNLLYQAEVRSSRLYQCPLYLWVAAGRRNIKGQVVQQLWLYIEYRDRGNRSCYSQFSFAGIEALDRFLEHELAETSLHEIHPENTQKNPIVPSIAMRT